MGTGCSQCQTIDTVNSAIIVQSNGFNQISPDYYRNSMVGGTLADTTMISPSMIATNSPFQDDYFTPSDRALGSNLKSRIPHVQWKRLDIFSLGISNFGLQTSLQYFQNIKIPDFVELYQILKVIDQHQQIKQRLIPRFNFQFGICYVYFPLQGRSHDPLQIVIDDYIPLSNAQLFTLPNTCKIWMLLVQKALAKLLGSYQRIKEISKQDLFEQITSIPIIQPQRSLWVRPNFTVSSDSYEIDPLSSVFYRFQLSRPTSLCITVWQGKTLQYSDKYRPVDLLAQLISPNDQRLGQGEIVGNKIFIKCDNHKIFNLQGGTYCIKIINRSRDIGFFTIVGYGSQRLQWKRRLNLQKVLFGFIRNIYNNAGNNTTRVPILGNTFLKFYDDNFRGILYIENGNLNQCRVRVTIKPEYARLFMLQSDPHLREIQHQLASKHYFLVSFIKIENTGFGAFYEVKIFDK